MEPINKKGQYAQARTAILFDAENISYRFADNAIELAQCHGKPIIRAYADFSRSHIKGWEKPALKHGIRTIHQYSYDTKNSSSDFLMMHDAFKLIHSGKIDTFVIATNDSDFITPIQLLRQSGAFVHGIGNKEKCSELLIESCNKFSFLNEEELSAVPLTHEKSQPPLLNKPKPKPQPLVAKKTVNKLIQSYQAIEKTKKGWVTLSMLCQKAEIPTTKYKKFSTLLKQTGRFELGDNNKQTKLIS
ncbi:hypothetical protein ACH42_01005 [Endozoicomonas sp. (ex Bugula neritina AB1)]|nr:hypothetical protein ACH42_01005 [Endozoicomonas sp. (ex Bugula neritina AB1)]